MKRWHLRFPMILLMCILLPQSIFCGDEKSSKEEGQFDIYIADKKIGQEKYSIVRSADSITSESTTDFRNPKGQRERVKIETKLKMDNRYMPQTYEARTKIGDRNLNLKGVFSPNEAAFQYQTDGIPGKNAFLVGDRYAILDSNVFHHFIFVERLFDFSRGRNSQSIEVVIPQEMDDGNLKITDSGIEQVSLREDSKELHHLKVDSGPLLIDMWVDEEHALYKIALPAKQIEVLRH
jgi:hypothetical protein